MRLSLQTGITKILEASWEYCPSYLLVACTRKHQHNPPPLAEIWVVETVASSLPGFTATFCKIHGHVSPWPRCLWIVPAFWHLKTNVKCWLLLINTFFYFSQYIRNYKLQNICLLWIETCGASHAALFLCPVHRGTMKPRHWSSMADHSRISCKVWKYKDGGGNKTDIAFITSARSHVTSEKLHWKKTGRKLNFCLEFLCYRLFSKGSCTLSLCFLPLVYFLRAQYTLCV